MTVGCIFYTNFNVLLCYSSVCHTIPHTVNWCVFCKSNIELSLLYSAFCSEIKYSKKSFLHENHFLCQNRAYLQSTQDYFKGHHWMCITAIHVFLFLFTKSWLFIVIFVYMCTSRLRSLKEWKFMQSTATIMTRQRHSTNKSSKRGNLKLLLMWVDILCC